MKKKTLNKIPERSIMNLYNSTNRFILLLTILIISVWFNPLKVLMVAFIIVIIDLSISTYKITKWLGKEKKALKK